MKRLAKEHICVTHGHRHQCGDGQERGVGAGWRRAKWQGAEIGDICNSADNKIRRRRLGKNKMGNCG